MDTHAIYEGAMRLLAAEVAGDYGHTITSMRVEDVQSAVDLAARTWRAAFDATKPVSREGTR